jgi:hypothetical protein
MVERQFSAAVAVLIIHFHFFIVPDVPTESRHISHDDQPKVISAL